MESTITVEIGIPKFPNRKMDIGQVLRGKNILITGATGFLGKVLLEKILRDVPDSGKIYLIIRNGARKRLEEALDLPIFEPLRSNHPSFRDYATRKLVPVDGDLSVPGFEISTDVMRELQQNIHVVIHLAALNDFFESLSSTLRTNVMATLELLDMAKKFRNIQAFIHSSVAYVNSDRKGFHLEELPPIEDAEEIFAELTQMKPEALEAAQAAILGNYPNTFIYTKALVECLLAKRRGNLPMSIVRPSIIGAVWRYNCDGEISM